MSELSTTTGQSIGNYPDYKADKTPEQIDVFTNSAKIPVAGKYDASSETMETKTVTLVDVIGGGVDPATDGGLETKGGKLQLKDIDTSSNFDIPYRTANGIKWKAAPAVYRGDGIAVEGSGGYTVSARLTENGGLEFDNEVSGKGIKVSNPVPDPGTNEHRGQVLTVNSSDQVVWDDAPTTAVPIDGTTITKNASDELQVANPVPSATGHNEGDVLTISNGGIGWVAPQGGGGGGGLPDTSLLANATSSYGDKLSEDTDTFDEDRDYEMRYSFIPTAMKPDGSIHTYKIKWYIRAGSGGFETAAVGSGSFT